MTRAETAGVRGNGAGSRGRGRRFGPAAQFALGAGALLWAALTLFACGKGPEIPEGIQTGEAVDARVRRDVEAAARTFLDRARAGDWDAVWNDAVAEVHRQGSREQFLGPIQRVRSLLGIPEKVETLDLVTVHFGESFPPRDKITFQAEGSEESTTFMLTGNPVQASLVQRSLEGPERFYLSTLWFQEEGRWKLAAFFAKPATAYGRTWEDYEEEASAQRLEGNIRNAALLYNLAIDLVVPAAWIKPAEVEKMERTQKRINVTQLPAGRLMSWPAPPDTFKVFRAQYSILPQGLCLLIAYESPVAVADTLGQAAYAGRLARYIREQFPEYPEVFSSVTLQAYDPADHRAFWSANYPLEKRP